MEQLLVYLGIGALAGLAAGLYGVGGGLIIVPALVQVFTLQHIPEAVGMHLAVGTSLASIVVTSSFSAVAHHRHFGAVSWPVVQSLAPGIVLGAALGALVADRLPGPMLKAFFGGFLLLVSARFLFQLSPTPRGELPGALGAGVVGAVIGAISAVVGIGGGTLTTPFLLWRGRPVHEAIGTAAACGVPIALIGAAGLALLGRGQAGLPSWATGYIYWPAVAGLVAASALAAPLGARWAHRLSSTPLRRSFGLLLALIGARMLSGG